MARKQSLDIDLVRQASSGRCLELLTNVCGIDSSLLDGNHHSCPKCGGTDRFRLIDETAGALLCNQCFSKKNGDIFAAVQWWLDEDFLSAAKRIADYLGVKPTEGKAKRQRKADPVKDLEFIEWNELRVAMWCGIHKKGIEPTALQRVGAKCAKYYGRHQVIAIPVWGQKLKAADPVGWVLYEIGGGTLPKFSKGKEIQQVKTKLTYGSQPGVIGPVDDIAKAKVIWKVEGVTDVLAALSFDLPDGEIAITNANGCGEKPAKWMLDLFTAKRAAILHDADKPGDGGAVEWAKAISSTAAESRHVRLPFEIAEHHGKDLRDWKLEGKTHFDLNELRNISAVVAKQDAPKTKPIEDVDDPNRLAMANKDRYRKMTGGEIRWWREEWYLWKGKKYQKIPVKDFYLKVWASVKSEFDRINIEEQENPEGDDKPKAVRKVTTTLIKNVVDATGSMSNVDHDIEPNTFLVEKKTKHWISMTNGILDLDALLDDRDDVLRKHTPDWWSTISMPYAFELNAECPKWLRFLDRSLESDQERIDLLQEWAGYLLLPTTDMQKFLFCEGQGSNGKSVFFTAIESMLGTENCSFVALDQLDGFSLSQTLGKLANLSGDTVEIDQSNEGVLKRFTSGDRSYFDRKGISGIDAVPTARLMFNINNRPRIKDKSSGIWRRMILMPWRVEIKQSEKILGMDTEEWWQDSGELPGIFRWAVLGLHRLRSQKNFTYSRVVEQALDSYRRESNPAREFLLDHIMPDDTSSIPCNHAYGFYRRWCEQNGYRPLASGAFGREVARLFIQSERKRSSFAGDRTYAYSGVKFSTDEICGESVNDLKLF